MTAFDAPTTISVAAQQWLAAGGDRAVEDAPETIPERRAFREEVYGVAGRSVLTNLGLSAETVALAGVPGVSVTPAGAPADRAIVYIHGGGFVFGSPAQDMPILAHLAALTGLRVLAPIYPLAPEHPFPAGLNAVLAFSRAAVEAHAGGISLAGTSAGGTFAAVTARKLQAESTPVQSLALLSPASDLSNHGDSALTDRDPVLPNSSLGMAGVTYAPGVDLHDPDVSPLFADYTPDFPNTLITTGTRDVLLSSCARLDRKLRQDGARSQLRVWEGMWHAFEFYADLPEAQASLKEIARFLLDGFSYKVDP